MRKKINRYLIGLSIAVVIAAMLSMTAVFYTLFQRQVRNDLRVNAEILRDTGLFDRGKLSDENEKEMFQLLRNGLGQTDALRVTWIDLDGTVLYDNDTDATQMENHADRPEFTQAIESGEGEITRRSDTMRKNTVYYALRLDDGSVLRLASDFSSIFSIFVSVVPVMLVIVLVIVLASAIIARMLTRQLMAPIDKIAQNLEDLSGAPVYEELVPFVNTIRSQHEDILSAAQVRQDFSANVSHELKTPLTAIAGYAELIENHMADSDQETRFAEQIRVNADRLLTLIDDIIRLSELDSSEADQMISEQMDLYETAKNCVDLLQVTAQEKRISLTLEGESCSMRGNKTMITELINNLCQNAIHYNRENGKVEVSVHLEQERPTLVVADTGIGIPKDLQERVFERFYRVDKSRSRETGGTGLGLAIVKHIVELHDAELTLQSEVGKGTVITVKF